MGKTHNTFDWRIYEKLLLCLASGICLGLILWIGMILAWNGFSYPDQEIDPFYPRLFLVSLILFSLILSYKYPGFFVLPIWGLSVVIFYYELTSSIDFIWQRNDITSPYYAPDTTWDHYLNSFTIAILTVTLISIGGLIRPVLFYFKVFWGEKS